MWCVCTNNPFENYDQFWKSGVIWNNQFVNLETVFFSWDSKQNSGRTQIQLYTNVVLPFLL